VTPFVLYLRLGETILLTEAGVGEFNATLALDWDPFEEATYFTRDFTNLFKDYTTAFRLTPSFVTDCPSSGCPSYYFPGGLMSVAPSITPSQVTPQMDIVLINNAPGLHVVLGDEP
jgi:hypothetical protein